MPQFDIASFPSQIFWLVVTFGILYFVMSKLVLPRVGDVFPDFTLSSSSGAPFSLGAREGRRHLLIL